MLDITEFFLSLLDIIDSVRSAGLTVNISIDDNLIQFSPLSYHITIQTENKKEISSRPIRDFADIDFVADDIRNYITAAGLKCHPEHLTIGEFKESNHSLSIVNIEDFTNQILMYNRLKEKFGADFVLKRVDLWSERLVCEAFGKFVSIDTDGVYMHGYQKESRWEVICGLIEGLHGKQISYNLSTSDQYIHEANELIKDVLTKNGFVIQ